MAVGRAPLLAPPPRARPGGRVRQSARGGPAAAGGAGRRAAGGGQSGPRASALRAPAGKARARASSRWFGAAQGTCAAAERAPPTSAPTAAPRERARARGAPPPGPPAPRFASPGRHLSEGPARPRGPAAPHPPRRAATPPPPGAPCRRRRLRAGPGPALPAPRPAAGAAGGPGRAAPRRAASPRSPGERWPGAALPPSPRGAGAGRWQTCAPLPPPCRRSCPLQGTDGVAPAAPSSRPATFTVPFVRDAAAGLARYRRQLVWPPSPRSLRTREPRAPATLAPFRSPLRGAAERRRRRPRAALLRGGGRWDREGAGRRGLARGCPAALGGARSLREVGWDLLIWGEAVLFLKCFYLFGGVGGYLLLFY